MSMKTPIVECGLLAALVLSLWLAGCADFSPAPAADVQRMLAPSGKLRVGVYLGGPSSAVRNAETGELSGVAHDLGRELARRLDVPFEPVIYRRSAEIIDALKAGGIDAGFVTLTPARAKDIDFSTPYLQIENGFLVPAGSGAKSQADVDRPGMRVAVLGGGTSDIALTRELKNAAIVRAAGINGGIELLRLAQADAFGAQKTILFEMSRQLPGSRVLDDRFTVERHAIGIPKGREAGKFFIEAFAADVRNNGLVRALVEKAGLRGTLEVKD
jgi:polar amino acid transport system substrate-binding protein